MSFDIKQLTPTTLQIVFPAILDNKQVSAMWHVCFDKLKQHAPEVLILDLEFVTYCDGAGIALINNLHEQQVKNNKKCDVHNLKPSLQQLFDYIAKQQSHAKSELPLNEGFPEQLGHMAIDTLETIRENIVFIGTLFYQMWYSLCCWRKIRWQDFLRIAEETGPHAVPLVALIGFLIGLISTFQAAPSFARFGAQIYMVDLVSLGLVREMGPLLTSVLLAGRTASAFAAEIGTMKINQELTALQTMGISPVRFLVIPRVLVTMCITPVLEIFFIIFGLLGSLMVMLTLGYTYDAFFHRLYQAVLPIDYLGGLIKVFVFGLVIAGVGCLQGIKTHLGAQAVGRSTTQAVVVSLVMLVIIDGIFAVIYYVLGI